MVVTVLIVVMLVQVPVQFSKLSEFFDSGETQGWCFESRGTPGSPRMLLQQIRESMTFCELA